MHLDAGYAAYFKLMHANVFTTRAALIIRHPAYSCDASVRPHELGRPKEGKKRGEGYLFVRFEPAHDIPSRICLARPDRSGDYSKIIYKNRVTLSFR